MVRAGPQDSRRDGHAPPGGGGSDDITVFIARSSSLILLGLPSLLLCFWMQGLFLSAPPPGFFLHLIFSFYRLKQRLAVRSPHHSTQGGGGRRIPSLRLVRTKEKLSKETTAIILIVIKVLGEQFSGVLPNMHKATLGLSVSTT